ncbi:MAG: matrixin family metalloprotease, partial [Planctomycetota bacterium]
MHPATLIRLAILIVVGTAPALAWEPTGETWPVPTVPYWVAPDFPTASGTVDQQISAIRGGATVWHEQGGSPFQFVYQGTVPTGSSDPFDGVHTFSYSPDSGGLGLVAVAIRGFTGSTMEGFDIVCFGDNGIGPVAWNGVGDPSVGEEDIAATSVHEFGHVLGLDHNGIPESSMYPVSLGVIARTLHPDDQEGVQALYGVDPTTNGGPLIDDVSPPIGSVGQAVTLIGGNFSWTAGTFVSIDGVELDPAFFVVESLERIQVLAMPPHAPGPVSIRIENELGSVELSAAFTYTGSGGSTTDGVLTCGLAVGEPGLSDVAVPLNASLPFDIGGFSCGFTFDPTRLNIDFFTLDGSAAEGAEFFGPAYDNVVGWWTVNVALDLAPPFDSFVPASPSALLGTAHYSVEPGSPLGFTPLAFENGIGAPPVSTVLSEFPISLLRTPTTNNGGVWITDGPAFVRGDGNRDGVVELSDAVFQLAWLFTLGPAYCLDAQDANDDGEPDVSDAIYLLTFLFAASKFLSS